MSFDLHRLGAFFRRNHRVSHHARPTPPKPLCSPYVVAIPLIFHLKVPSSIPSKVHLNVDSNPVLCEKSVVNALPKVVGFLRVLRFPPTGKVDWVG